MTEVRPISHASHAFVPRFIAPVPFQALYCSMNSVKYLKWRRKRRPHNSTAPCVYTKCTHCKWRLIFKVELRSVRLVAAWTWDAGDDACGICRNPFDACCPDCHLPGDDCPIIWGQCSHPFHMHCILKWINAQPPDAQKCPMCRQDWKVKHIPKPSATAAAASSPHHPTTPPPS